MVNCPMCHGEGRVHWDLGGGAHWQDCPHCEGSGQVSTDVDCQPGGLWVVEVAPVECADCIGRGWKECYRSGRLSDWVPGTCQSCKGAGQVLREAA